MRGLLILLCISVIFPYTLVFLYRHLAILLLTMMELKYEILLHYDSFVVTLKWTTIQVLSGVSWCSTLLFSLTIFIDPIFWILIEPKLVYVSFNPCHLKSYFVNWTCLPIIVLKNFNSIRTHWLGLFCIVYIVFQHFP